MFFFITILSVSYKVLPEVIVSFYNTCQSEQILFQLI